MFCPVDPDGISRVNNHKTFSVKVTGKKVLLKELKTL